MTGTELQSDETPRQRVTVLLDLECRDCLEELIDHILRSKSVRNVADILHEHRLLAAFEVYDADEEARP